MSSQFECDDTSLVQKIIAQPHQTFSLKHLGEVHYFLGLEALHSSSGILLTQTKYINDLLHKTNMFHSKPCATPYYSSQKLSLHDSDAFDMPSIYRSTVGALQYLTLTRSNISWIVNKLSKFLQAPTLNHWVACKRVLRCLKGSVSTGLKFTPSSSTTLKGYADADWASCQDDRCSTSGYYIFLGPNLLT
ncbi:hypothetical protein DH2020_004092 [Rehmannia glutinosa]|uniref:Reverse transcriptase Ty1/copia-type domain-containing protein n=1 Tax=Rehmannia glutinosa TaxID=99300 RepID=A0ABR0XNV6_REHGL